MPNLSVCLSVCLRSHTRGNVGQSEFVFVRHCADWLLSQEDFLVCPPPPNAQTRPSPHHPTTHPQHQTQTPALNIHPQPGPQHPPSTPAPKT